MLGERSGRMLDLLAKNLISAIIFRHCGMDKRYTFEDAISPSCLNSNSDVVKVLQRPGTRTGQRVTILATAGTYLEPYALNRPV
jgi:hypothetical protein